MTRTVREWNCNCASASEAGDYLQVLFEETAGDEERYVLIQTQFEFPQNYDIKVETDGGEWYAELRVNRATLDRQRLLIDGNDGGILVRMLVNHVADDRTYADLKRVLKIMLPDIVID